MRKTLNSQLEIYPPFSSVLSLNSLNYHSMPYKCVSCRFEILKCKQHEIFYECISNIYCRYSRHYHSFDVIPYAGAHQRAFM